MANEIYKKILRRMLIENNEYSFESEEKAERYLDKVLYEANSLYDYEHYYHKYPDFKDFLYTSQVDGIAYHVFEGEYGEY